MGCVNQMLHREPVAHGICPSLSWYLNSAFPMNELQCKRLAACLTIGTLALLALPLRAEEPPHLEFVRGLRSRGMADLALQYLQSKGQAPPPELAVILPLELAKTRLELAAVESDYGRRTTLQNQARAEFDLFVKKNPKHPLAADAALEIARISAQQGKAMLSRAQRQETREAQRAELLRARAQFEEAAKQLQAAAKQIDSQPASNVADTTKQLQSDRQALAQSRLQADLELGINLLDQARTYTDDSDAVKRGEVLQQSIKALEKLSKRDTKNPLCWLALVWIGRCQQINDDAKAARAVYKDVLAEPGEHVETARRLARYFRMRALATDPEVKKPIPEIQKAGEEWLTLYPNYLNTPEGYGVRFELANAYVQQVTSLPKAQQQTPRAREILEKARKLYHALEQSENDFTTQARESKQGVILAISQGRSKGDISKLKDFEECYLRAQYEMALMHEDAKKQAGNKAEEKQKGHFKNILAALVHGIDLADAEVPPDEVYDARYLLAYAFLATGDYYRAVVAGEDMARAEPRALHAPMAGAYALRAYGLLIGAAEQAGATREDVDPLRTRLRSLAIYIEQSWPSDPAADVARHMTGLVLLGEKDYPAAVEVLERISPTYPEATRSYFQLAAAALQAQKDEAKPPPGKASYQDRAVAALLKIPELSTGADSSTIHDYVLAKMMLANNYYRLKQFEKMDQLADALLKQLDALDEKTKEEHRTSVVALTLYAKLGRAEADYAAGHYAKVRELLDPLAKQVQDPAQARQWSELKEAYPQIVRQLLGLALRSNVQDSKIERAKELLDLLQRTFPQNSLEIMVGFVQQLKAQIEQLRQQGEPAKPQLDKTVANFANFLDELTKQQEKSPKPEIFLFLAQSYSSLDKHSRAAELADKISEPKSAGGNAQPDSKQLAVYHAARILRAREMRLDKQYTNAETALQEIMSKPWGKASLEVKKEGILLLEDQEKYTGKAGAIFAWNALMGQMKRRLEDNKIKEQYFDCYYHMVYCMYKNALKMKEPKSDDSIAKAATYIVSLETRLKNQPDPAAESCKNRFEELIQAEPALKKKYDALKKSQEKGQP